MLRSTGRLIASTSSCGPDPNLVVARNGDHQKKDHPNTNEEKKNNQCGAKKKNVPNFVRETTFQMGDAKDAIHSKRTKRKKSTDDATLDDHIQAKRLKLVEQRDEARVLQAQVDEMRARARGLTKRYQQRAANDLLKEADQLEEEVRIRRSMTREHDFERNVVTYLKTYCQRSTVAEYNNKSDAIQAFVKQTDQTKVKQATILDEFLTEMDDAPAKVAMSVRDECVTCAGVKLLLCATKSIMTCPVCGYSVAYLDATSTSTSFDDVVEFSQYSYKRVNHYVMWIALVQGKEAHRVSDDIMQKVMQDLYARQKVTQAQDVTYKRVREALRKLKLRKAYDHVTQITMRISGIRPTRLSAQTEEKLKNMFLQMQPAFQQHAPKTRTNFLSYSYVLYRCFQILKLDHMLDRLVLLKGRDKLEANDAIFRKMSQSLGWPVFDLPPASDTVAG